MTDSSFIIIALFILSIGGIAFSLTRIKDNKINPKVKDQLLTLSIIPQAILGFYCFTQLNGTNPVTIWYGWVGIFGMLGALYTGFRVGMNEVHNRNARKALIDPEYAIDTDNGRVSIKNRKRKPKFGGYLSAKDKRFDT